MTYRTTRYILPVAFAVAVATGGCTRPNDSTAGTAANAKAGAKADPWEAVARAVRKDGSPAAVAVALRQVGNDLGGRPDLPPLPPTPADRLAAVGAVVPLSPADQAELAGAGFTPLDAAYIADCLYLLDAARAAVPPTAPPADQARAGFDWVCRQVYVQPWAITAGPLAGRVIPAVPPTAVLRRGSGSGLERGYVFLALLQQLGIDGCFVGPPGAADKPAGVDLRGPFWAAGARVGGDVLLFDPWRGAAVPGPGGAGVATLAQLKADPGVLKPWFDGDKGPWPATPDQIKAAVAYPVVPVNALSARMAALDGRMKADPAVRLAVDPAALRDRFPKDPPAAVWNPPADPFAYGRVATAFLPAEAGGRHAELQLAAVYAADQVPRAVLTFPPELTAPLVQAQLVRFANEEFKAAFLTPPTPRERLHRGQFQDASRLLIEKQDGFKRGEERLATADDDQFRAWADAANRVYDDLDRAERPNPLDRTARAPDGDPAVADARAQAARFWQDTSSVIRKLVDRAVAGVGRAEAAYLLALVKHEEAERRQARTPASAPPAWAEAANAWAGFLDQPAARAFPGRAEHATALAAAAARAAGKK